ncbi:hypothetical protein D0962_00925 [Leptolyngbyaceae cyanobacterium CCMR0082]|uniref:Uncharacterized protein n=2 Tax=Adonisia TaxID=2950183 RepID=A0A6M0RYQ9_9CYAN|nr:hypothetical protein [Adonisia turfae CCMR0082]
MCLNQSSSQHVESSSPFVDSPMTVLNQPNPKSHGLKLGCLGCAGMLAIIIGLGSLWLLAPNWVENHNPFMQQHMIDVAWEWGNFAPIPPEATDLQIMTSGSSFSRTFKGSFSAERSILEKWIQDSPGLNLDEGTRLESGKFRYTISPNGGAGFGSVDLDPQGNMIYFTVSWS